MILCNIFYFFEEFSIGAREVIWIIYEKISIITAHLNKFLMIFHNLKIKKSLPFLRHAVYHENID